MSNCLKLNKNLTCFENLDWKSDALLKICFKIWSFSKVFIHKLVFINFFSLSRFLRKQITAENGVLRDKKFQKSFSASKTFIKICFFYKSNSLRNLIRCKTVFYRNLTRSKILDLDFVEFQKIGSKSDALELLDSKYDALYKNDSKTDFFSKILTPILFLNENIFFCNNFSENAQKSQHWSLYGVYWPAKFFFESQFSKKFWFSNNTFFIENWCVVNILTQVLTLCGTQIKLWHENFRFV